MTERDAAVSSPQVLVDADACPVKQEVYRVQQLDETIQAIRRRRREAGS